MSILINETTRVLVQGITGRDGSFHTKTMLADGTKVVAGVTPGKGGQEMEGVPVYNSVADALDVHQIDASVIFVPAKFAVGAIREAADAGVPLVICITEGVPVNEMLGVYHYVKAKGVRLIGPNCPGLISPGQCKIGIMPARIHVPGSIGVISRSGTLTYEVVHALSGAGMGQSTCVGIGGDPVVGSGFIDLLDEFNRDPDTAGVVMIGEIGGEDEEAAAAWITKHMNKPVVGFISGRTAPPGKRMGHAGAIISGGKGTPEAKVAALEQAGVPVARTPSEIPGLLKERLG
ncbi:succinate--CoA ligase subunit alpha [Spirochaeta lutea]|uniref:Succinate--CoA ligase [ADP-forming] subunit alpha n=1 Tax=Spirochaeta lutea TaxID=1480694 RepID=A0A098QSS8_9SPIO|nr:succinate--CoA ligase subunit alpha [Spirochaeta lutea]KGE70905.1 succinyl-CoA synthetase subsunit alpha [Spirochaeta lutea]